MRTPAAHPTPAKAGLTLVELLLVMGLLALVMGAGVGTLATLNPGERAAVGVVQDSLRSAHNSAISRVAPARVRIDLVERTLVAEAMSVVGTWHFEDAHLSGGDGMGGVFFGMEAAVSPGGWIGKGLDFRGAPRGSEVEFPIQDDPAFDLTGGFSIDLAIKPGSLKAGRLLEISDCLEVDLTSGGGVKMKIYRRAVESTSGHERRGVGLTLESEPGLLREGRWVQLRLQYDRRHAKILVDGLEAASAPGEFKVWKLEHSMRLGGGASSVDCMLDELSLAVVAASEELRLPGDVRFLPDTPRMIQFVAGGALDPTLHFEPVVIGLEFPSGRQEQVLVGLYGTVE